jgi:hypothetical protein
LALIGAIGLTFLFSGPVQAQTSDELFARRQQEQVRVLHAKHQLALENLQHKLALEKMKIGDTPEEQEIFRHREATEMARLQVKHNREIEQLTGAQNRAVIARQYAAERKQRMLENQLAYQRAAYQQQLYLNQLYLQQAQNQIYWQNNAYNYNPYNYGYGYGQPVYIYGWRCR